MRPLTRKKRSGGWSRWPAQSTVEFALVLLVLCAIVYGLLEISRLIFINTEVENAAREATHYAARHPTASAQDLMTAAIAPRLTLIDANSPDLAVSAPTFPRGLAHLYPVEVTVTYTWTSLVNIMPDVNTLSLRPLGPLELRTTAMTLIEGR